MRKRLWPLLLVVPAAAAVLSFLMHDGPTPASGTGRIEFPPPPAPAVPTGSAAAGAVTFDDFVGAAACAECHPDQYDAWSVSTHGRAGGAPTPESVIAPFDGTQIRFSDAVVTPNTTATGEYTFTVAQNAFPEVVLVVDAVIGGGHMVGGGTQGFLTRFPDGTVRFLPFDFSRQEDAWFCNTGPTTSDQWAPITDSLPLRACVDWPPKRILGQDPRFSNCQGCHGSQIQVRFVGGAEPFQTKYTSLAVNCESCHGPGRRHVELARAGDLRGRVDIGMRPLATLSEDESLAVCFRCHALKDALAPGYLPGKPLLDHFALKLPLLGDAPFFADGRVRTFAYQQNHLYSDCYLTGTMTCVDCHDPHTQGYRDVFGRPLESRFSDGQCLACHPSKEPVQTHTHHPPESAGSRCVACHMPYLQQPMLGEEIPYARSDHTIPIPRPAFDAALGVQNACAKCHTDQSTAALAARTEAWWGPLKPHDPLVDGLLRAADLADRSAVAELVLDPSAGHPMAQVAGLSRFLERFLAPDMPALEPAVVQRLMALSGNDAPDVKALALASLHLARGDDPDVRAFLADALERMGQAEARIRARWALVLGHRADVYRTGGDFTAAIAAYRKALEITPDDPRIHLNLGLAYSGAGNLTGAISEYRRSLELDPKQTLALVNLASTLGAAGRPEPALATLRAAIRLNPHEPIAYFNLGNSFLRRDQPAQAIEAYRRAAALDRSNEQAHFYLARAYILSGRYADALDAVRHGLAFAPDDATGRQMLADLERALGRAGTPRP